MTSPIPITLVGATGLTGSAALNALIQSKSCPFTITTIARKAINPLPASHTSTTYSHNLVSDLFDAPNDKVAEKGGIYASCLGTTRASAGSFEAQEKLDLGLNRDLAKRAKQDGASTVSLIRLYSGRVKPRDGRASSLIRQLILVSSGGSSSSSMFPYTKMKGRLEDAVKEMDFEHCVILRPGLLLGPRSETRGPEYATQVLFRGLRGVGLPMGRMCIDAEDVGACIAQLAAHPPAEKVVTFGNNEMIDLANKWKAANQA